MNKEMLKIALSIELLAFYFANLICMFGVEPIEMLKGNILIWAMNIIVFSIIKLMEWWK